tara:strand:+ start:469 stop:717 length:249 start_codon:yes stop_codon:yes gene_type:complete
MSWENLIKIKNYDTLSYLNSKSLDSLHDLLRQLDETIYELQSSKLGSDLRDKPESNLSFRFLLDFKLQLKELLFSIEEVKMK